MKRIIGSLLIITFLNGCSLPLIGSFTSSGITGVATGNYQKSLISSAIDFSVYESTGKQRTLSEHIKLEKVAKSAGYKKTLSVCDTVSFRQAIENLMKQDGPSFLLAKVAPSFKKETKRVTHTPEEIKKRFMRAVSS